MSVTIQSNLLKNLFRNIYFINGTAYAGKSTMIKMLAQKHNGICCGENYHDELMNLIDVENQPNLSYFQTMKDWNEFLSRTPKEYADWIDGCGNEAADLEIIKLIQLSAEGKKIFVDTNIPLQRLYEISDYNHVAIMAAKQSTSVERFFERDDEEKQFILSQIESSDNPAAQMENYRKCLAMVNSVEKYNAFVNFGFYALERDDKRTPEETMMILEKHFKL